MSLNLSMKLVSSENTRFTADFVLTNNLSQTLSDWQLHLNHERKIETSLLHNMELVAQHGSYIALKPQKAIPLAPGESFSFSLTGTGLGIKKFDDLPKAIYLSQSSEVFDVALLPVDIPCKGAPLTPSQVAEASYSIVPQPAEIAPDVGTYQLGSGLSVSGAQLCKTGLTLLGELAQIEVKETSHAENLALISDKLLAPESYRLSIKENGIRLHASDHSGFLYGLGSLAQLVNSAGARLPCMDISDSPRFSYRGMMLDCARHFHGVDKIKQLLLLMSYYKLNIFHWHFTDDEAWRLEIKSLPQLTERAAYRGHNLPVESQFGSGPDAYGGYYSHDDVKEIVAYAQSLNITVIPEIDVPGHSRAAIKALPELLVDSDDKSQYRSVQLYTDNILNPALPGTYEFLDKVLEEVCDLFPGPYLHMGADEVPKGAWVDSVRCQEMLKRHNYTDVGELQGHLLRYVQDKIRTKGKTLFGWEEAVHGDKLAKDAGICAWTGIDNGIKAANQGYQVVMCPAQYCYFDLSVNNKVDEIGVYWAGTTDLEKAYSYEPLNDQLTEQGATRILGVQCALWSELISSDERIDAMLFPRLLALSETAWSQAQHKNWDKFSSRLPAHYRFLAKQGVQYRRP